MEQFIESLRSSATRLSAAMRTGPLDAPVRACPGWSLADLGRHMGVIHRWARLAAVTGAAPVSGDIEEPPADDQLGDWIDAGAQALIEALADIQPDSPTWHPFPVPRVAAVWPRRQAHETLIHAWDAEQAIGTPGPLDPAIAADNVAEYFEVMIPRVLMRTGTTAPVGVLAITCTDAGTRLVVRSDDGTTVAVDPSATPQAELHGAAEDLALALWGRRPLDDPPAHPLVTAWLAFGGN